MYRYVIALLILMPLLSHGQMMENAMTSSQRASITSTYLQEDRAFQVYLPPSYFFSDKNDFPVVYLVDGDYNFHHDTGLIELLSSVSERIPEMIVVGIATGKVSLHDF